MPGTPCGCTDGNGDGLSIAVPVFFLGGRKRAVRRSGRAGQPAEQSAVLFRSKALRFRPMPPPFHGRISPWRQGRLSAGKCG